MPLTTTVIGAFPKPNYLQTPDWFRFCKDPARPEITQWDTDLFTNFNFTPEAMVASNRATKEVLKLQEQLGIDIVSDGEIKRENYILHFCRRLKGMDFEDAELRVYREGACSMKTPVVRRRLEPQNPEPWCVHEWKETQALTDRPVKYTLPGPMTIADSTINKFYTDNHEQQLRDLCACLNIEVRALAKAGCKHIQIDEPLLVRQPEVAIKYGIDILAECFQGVNQNVEKIVHLCCGYPTFLDEENYKKADRSCYSKIADKLDKAGFDALSFEDAHCYNDLNFLDKYKNSKIIFGSVAVAKSAIETKDAIENRLREVLKHVPAERLIVAPDCGLGYLPSDILHKKLTNMVAAAKALP